MRKNRSRHKCVCYKTLNPSGFFTKDRTVSYHSSSCLSCTVWSVSAHRSSLCGPLSPHTGMWRSVCWQLQHNSLHSKLAAYEKKLSSGKDGKPWMFNVTDIPWSSIQALTTDIRLPKRLCVFGAACLPENIAVGSLHDYLTAQLMTWLPARLHSQQQG